jgi:drug/metabolite transporter (DMT)-like permease
MYDVAPGYHFRVNAYAILFSGIAAISTGAVFVRLADAPSLVIAAYRVGIAALVILPLACWKTRSELRSLSISDLKYASMAGFFLALHFAAWITSLQYTSIAVSVTLVNTSPLWVGLLAPVVTKERIKRVTVSAVIVSIAGCAIIGFNDFYMGSNAFMGDLLALTGGLCAAGYLLMGKKLRNKLSLMVYISVCYGSAAVILWAIVLTMNLQVTGFSNQTIAAFCGMALISQVIGHSCYNWALKYFSTSLVAMSFLGEPVGSTILAYIIFHESLTIAKAAGAILILSAIYFAAKAEA